VENVKMLFKKNGLSLFAEPVGKMIAANEKTVWIK
jgi:hypothetical protein